MLKNYFYQIVCYGGGGDITKILLGGVEGWGAELILLISGKAKFQRKPTDYPKTIFLDIIVFVSPKGNKNEQYLIKPPFK